MRELRFAVLGCGFWSQFQIAAWRELPGVRLVALYNRTRAKAEALARRFDVPAVYDDAEKLLSAEKLDFVDIITDVDTHPRFVELAAAHRVPVICQKPMAPTLEQAEQMVACCRQAGVPLLIHENWRWQRAIREFQRSLNSGDLGRCFRGRIAFCNSFPVFDNQPFLREMDRFIIADMGSHILDVARFLFGEARCVYCLTRRVTPGIRGEDVATVVMVMGPGTTVTCEISYASRMEHDRFPETFVLSECERGSVELAPDYWIRTTTRDGTHARRRPPPMYLWADPAYAAVHSSIVACNANLLGALRGDAPAETTGDDNLRTVRLVFGAYDSAACGQTLRIPNP